jgi:hypothetical protein
VQDLHVQTARSGEQIMQTLRAHARASYRAGKLPRPATAGQQRDERIAFLQQALADARAQITRYEAELEANRLANHSERKATKK